jgi:SAM-dependent methyltransferase
MAESESQTSLADIGKFHITHRELSDYEYFFQFQAKEMMPNSRVLDLGSGISQELARDLRRIRPDIQVISIDPSLVLPPDEESLKKMGIVYSLAMLNDSDEERAKRNSVKVKNLIAAVAPNLPIKSKSFDYVFDSHGPYLYLKDDQLKVDYIKEIVRIGAKNATIGIYPLEEIANESLEMLVAGDFNYDSIDDEVCRRSKVRNESILERAGITSYKIFELHDTTVKDEKEGKSGSKKVGVMIQV